MTKSPSHFLFVALPFFGHARPLAGIAANLLKLYPELRITFISAVSFQPAIEAEFAAHEMPVSRTDRLKVIAFGAADAPPDPEVNPNAESPGAQLSVMISAGFQSLTTDLPRCLEGILGRKTVMDRATQKEVDVFEMLPTLAVVDMFHYSFPEAYAQVATKLGLESTTIPYMLMFPGACGATTRHFHHDPDVGDVPQLRPRFKAAKAAHPDWTDEQCWIKAAEHWEGKIVQVPGYPTLFDYEYMPQAESAPTPYFASIMTSRTSERLFPGAIGSIQPVPAELEFPGAVEGAATAIVKGKTLEMLPVGPQFPTSTIRKATQPEEITLTESMKSSDPVVQFLNKAYTTHGRASAVYVSFGSIFFPTARIDLIESLVDTLIDLDIPFVFALASPSSQMGMTPELMSKIDTSGLGMTTKFAPQHDVLAHPATGWFLSHCGSNSWCEAVMFGVPLIAWPCMADQPGMAALAGSRGLNIGVELIQVRTGANVGKPTSYGPIVEGTPEAAKREMQEVFGKIKNKQLEDCRASMAKATAKMQQSMEVGASRESFEKFGKWVSA